MCEIWRKSKHDEMTLEQIDALFSQLRRLDGIRISGGEPFLRSDLSEIINIIQRKTSPSVVHITTNGLLTERIVEFIKSVDSPGKIHFKISIDAVGERHDGIRGVQGAYRSAIDTLRELARLKGSYYFYLGVDQTIVNSDVESIQALQRICEDMGISLHQVIAYGETALYQHGDGLSLLPSSSAGIKTFGEFSKGELEHILALMGENASKIDDFTEKITKRYYLRGLRNRLLLGKAKPRPKCVALGSHLRILPNGDVPICLYDSTIVGNLTKVGFKELWFGGRMGEYRDRVKRCPGCWAGCEVIPNAIYSGDIIRALW
ncbi:MAG: radical SAM protein [Dehalococcoidia bacterium]|nr:MAG: radical SAM protein [Dehalococcoidia bacterium]